MNPSLLCQADPLWSALKIGESDLTLGRYGCTTTCLCMVSAVFELDYTPGTLSKMDIYTKDGLVVWQKLPNVGLKATRYYGFEKAKVDQFITDSKNQVILEVRTKFGPHWVLITGDSNDGGYLINDPLDGKKKTTTTYPVITGYAVISKDEKKKLVESLDPNKPSPGFEKSWGLYEEKQIIRSGNPRGDATIPALEQILNRLKVRDTVKGSMSREEMVEALYKLSGIPR